MAWRGLAALTHPPPGLPPMLCTVEQVCCCNMHQGLWHLILLRFSEALNLFEQPGDSTVLVLVCKYRRNDPIRRELQQHCSRA